MLLKLKRGLKTAYSELELELAKGGEIFVPKIPSMKITD